jgi:hypothetical protein
MVRSISNALTLHPRRRGADPGRECSGPADNDQGDGRGKCAQDHHEPAEGRGRGGRIELAHCQNGAEEGRG